MKRWEFFKKGGMPRQYLIFMQRTQDNSNYIRLLDIDFNFKRNPWFRFIKFPQRSIYFCLFKIVFIYTKPGPIGYSINKKDKIIL